MGLTTTVATGEWNNLAGLWIWVRPDPLVGDGHVRLTVHPQPLVVHVEGANAGVHVQAYPPDTHDFASTNGEPL